MKQGIKTALLYFFIISIVTSVIGCKIDSPFTNMVEYLIQVEINKESLSSIPFKEMVSVIGGIYPQSDGTNSFNHTISNFYIAKYEVTYELWFAVYSWADNHGYIFSNSGIEGFDGIEGENPTSAKHEPVTSISWRDALIWCNAYSEMTGLDPVYYSNQARSTVLKISSNSVLNDTTEGSIDNPFVNWTADGYRLPTEGEWQFAGTSKGITDWNAVSGDLHPIGNSYASPGDYSWYGDNSSGDTHIVGTKLANELNIYDLSGNVFEWCWDWTGDYPGTSTDYRGLPTGDHRVIRGGSFTNTGDPGIHFLEVGYRKFYSPYNVTYNLGFRLAKSN